MKHTITEFEKNFYILQEERVRQFLFVGPEGALLVDLGFPESETMADVRTITDKPVKVILTHADGDHTGGLREVGACLIHPREAHRLPEGVKGDPVEGGDRLTVGDFTLEVVEMPGHTHGAIGLLERSRGWFFPGDSVQHSGPIFMFGPERDLDAYIKNLEELTPLEKDLKYVFPCHSECPVEPQAIHLCREDALRYQRGELKGEPHPGGMPCHVYKGEWTTFLFP